MHGYKLWKYVNHLYQVGHGVVWGGYPNQMLCITHFQLEQVSVCNEALTPTHDDIKWKHFPRYWPFVRGIHWSPQVFFDLRPNKRLSKQWFGWWFETQSHPLWVIVMGCPEIVWHLFGLSSEPDPVTLRNNVDSQWSNDGSMYNVVVCTVPADGLVRLGVSDFFWNFGDKV